jgi:hypothetical protein
MFEDTLHLKLLGPEKREDQVSHDKKRHDYSDNILYCHGPSLKTIAATDIQACDYEKTHRDDNKYKVSHESLLKLTNLPSPIASAMPRLTPQSEGSSNT